MSISIVRAHKQFIHTKLTWTDGKECYFTAVYACPRRYERKVLWEEIHALAQSIQEPWMLAGDWNSILDSSEKKGGNPPDLNKCREFREVLSDLNYLIWDIGATNLLGIVGLFFKDLIESYVTLSGNMFMLMLL